MHRNGKTIREIFHEGTAVDRALALAVRDTLIEHKKLGYPIVIWRDGRVVTVPPEEIVIPEVEDEPSEASRET
jgi:hypothetical protein